MITSISKLKPLLTRIEATDDLIDQIVYKLYWLTEEEILVLDEGKMKHNRQKHTTWWIKKYTWWIIGIITLAVF